MQIFVSVAEIQTSSDNDSSSIPDAVRRELVYAGLSLTRELWHERVGGNPEGTDFANISEKQIKHVQESRPLLFFRGF